MSEVKTVVDKIAHDIAVDGASAIRVSVTDDLKDEVIAGLQSHGLIHRSVEGTDYVATTEAILDELEKD